MPAYDGNKDVRFKKDKKQNSSARKNSKPNPPMQQNQQAGNGNPALDRNSLVQQSSGSYPKNIPMMALQQQKVGTYVFRSIA